MKIETSPRDDHQLTMIVSLETEQMEGAKRRAARRLSEQKTIPGFRPGKAPYDVVRRAFGEAAVNEEALDLLVDEIYPAALKEANIDPAAPGKLEKVDNPEAPQFTFLIPLEPTVDLGDYRAIRLPYEYQAPGDEEGKAALEELRRAYGKTETVERPIQEGDFVMLDLKGKKAGASEDDAPLIERAGHPVFVQPEEKKNEWPFPGFSRKLIGLKSGESKALPHKYTEEIEDETLRKQNVKFDVSIRAVRGMLLPDLNDDFARLVGSFANLDALRSAVRANLEQQAKQDYDNAYYSQLLDKICEGAVIKYPPQVLAHEVEHFIENTKKQLAEQGLEFETYLKTREMDIEKFKEGEAQPAAIRHLERSLLLEEVARVEKIELSKESLDTEFQQTIGALQSSEEFQKATRGKLQTQQVMDAIAVESASRVITRQTMQRLKDIAMGQAPELAAGEKKKEKTMTKKPPAKRSTTRKAESKKAPAKPRTTEKKKETSKK